MRRYIIQACSLEAVKRKHQVKWTDVSRTWTLDGAKSRMRRMDDYTRDLYTVYRVVDSKTGRPVA